jgi:hypothetical protein
MKAFGIGILALLCFVAVTWTGIAINYGTYAFWAPKFKTVERNVYQQTPSYINGNLSDLRDMRDQINRASDPAAKASSQAALRDKINHLPPDFPVPADVRAAAYN